MTIVSKGYDRAINYADLGMLLATAGSAYTVFGDTSFQVTAGAGARELAIAPGRASGKGIYDVSDATEVRVGAPGARWDTLVLRRDWGAGDDGETDLVLLQGTGVKQITFDPAAVGGGILDDQPIALVRWANGLSAVQEIVDLRVWSRNGGAYAVDPLARGYMNDLGTRLRIGSSQWERVIIGSLPTWVDFAAAANIYIRRNNANLSVQDGLTTALDEVSGAVARGISGGGGKLVRFAPSGHLAGAAPADPDHFATKKYVDDGDKDIRDAVPRGIDGGGGKLVRWSAGGFLAGASPVDPDQFATKRYVDAADTAIFNNSVSRGISGGQNKLARFSATGQLAGAAPTQGDQFATADWVNDKIDVQPSANKVVQRGDGGRILVGDPVSAQNAVTLGYLNERLQALSNRITALENK